MNDTVMDELLDSIEEWAASRHTRISAFSVCRRDDSGSHLDGSFRSLREARAAARMRGHDLLGRPPAIYAVTPEGWARRIDELGID